MEEMEQLQAQREMALQCREAVDQQQLLEIGLSRSLALDHREKLLLQRERKHREACAQPLNRYFPARSKRRSLVLVPKVMQSCMIAGNTWTGAVVATS